MALLEHPKITLELNYSKAKVRLKENIWRSFSLQEYDTPQPHSTIVLCQASRLKKF